jgi:hypothetical protein
MDYKGSFPNVDGPCILRIELHVPRRDIEKFQEISMSENHGTYRVRFIRNETTGMDLHIGTSPSTNSSALEVACPPPGIRAKI